MERGNGEDGGEVRGEGCVEKMGVFYKKVFMHMEYAYVC